jgi:hypothetical protein
MLATIQSRTFLSSCLLSKIIKIGIYRTIILFVVLYGYKNLDKHRLRVPENRVLRRIFRLKGDEVTSLDRVE